MILNRGDKQYTDIEKFKKYELTTCIAYEMAIRNDEVINIIKTFLMDLINTSQTTIDTKEFNKIISKNSKSTFEYFFIDPYSLYLEYHFFDDIKEVIENIPNFNKSNSNLLFDPKEKYSFKDDTSLYSDEDIEKYILGETMSNDLFHYDFHSSLTETIENRLTPNYSRPLSVPSHTTREKDIYLNLSLPPSELHDFIERLVKKSQLNKISKSIYDFYGFEEEFESINGLNIQNNYADMFFCYDCSKLDIKISVIKHQIDDYRLYHSNSGHIKEETIKKYIKHGKEYIDNQKYKHLVI